MRVFSKELAANSSARALTTGGFMASNTINLGGRIPMIRNAMSNRLIVVAAAVAVLFIVSVVFGFHYRMQKQQARKEQQQTATVASSEATSNRQQVQDTEAAPPSVPIPTTPPAPAASPTFTPVPTPAGYTVPPMQFSPGTPGVQPSYYPAAYSPAPQAPQQTPQQRHLDRVQQAMDAPTGVSQQSQAPAPAQPLSDAQQLAETQRLLSQAAPYSASQAPALVPVGRPEASPVGPNDQAGKALFAQPKDDGDYLKTTRTLPVSPYVIQRGTAIPAAIPSQINSELPGGLIAEVVRDVYDSPAQKYILIPAGSHLNGEYNSNTTYGQNRVQVVWTSIYFPDGTFIDLDRMPTHDAAGAAGLHDQTDNHWSRVIGGVALSSVLAAGLQISQNRTNGSVLSYPSTGQVAASAVGTQASELGQQITNRNLSIPPTQKVRPGMAISVMVNKDMVFPGPYQAMELPQ
jgi:type IV secretion system protein TrbI